MMRSATLVQDINTFFLSYFIKIVAFNPSVFFIIVASFIYGVYWWTAKSTTNLVALWRESRPDFKNVCRIVELIFKKKKKYCLKRKNLLMRWIITSLARFIWKIHNYLLLYFNKKSIWHSSSFSLCQPAFFSLRLIINKKVDNKFDSSITRVWARFWKRMPWVDLSVYKFKTTLY